MCRPYFVFSLLILVPMCSAFADQATVTVTIQVTGTDAVAVNNTKDHKGCECDHHYQGPPCSCLQQLWLKYPGSHDLYICWTFPEVDNCEDGEEEMWYGDPWNPNLPQICDKAECEPIQTHRGREGLPGHGLDLGHENAWKTIKVGLKLARQKNEIEWGEPQYHRIPRQNVPANLEVKSDVTVMAVPITVKNEKSPFHGRTYHLCVQIASAPEAETTSVDFSDGEPRRGRQFYIEYRVEGDQRKGLVWLE